MRRLHAATLLAAPLLATLALPLLAEGEPARLPPHPFDTIGANAYLRWKEWQARAE